MKSAKASPSLVKLLDAPTPGLLYRVLKRILSIVGIGVESLDFLSGNLRTEEGKRVPLVAHFESEEISRRVSEQLMQSGLLASINTRWQRNTVRLHVTRRLVVALVPLVSRILAAKALSSEKLEKPCVILHRRLAVDGDWLQGHYQNDVDLHLCRGRSGAWDGWAPLLKNLIVAITRILALGAKRVRVSDRGHNNQGRSVGVNFSGPSLLELQGDDLSTDRSYRTQPHWLFPESSAPHFRTFVLSKSDVLRVPSDVAELAKYGVTVLEKPLQFIRFWPPHPALRRLWFDAIRCCAAGLVGSLGTRRAAYWWILQLFARAWFMARLCIRLDVKVFMSGEQYPIEVDAMQLIGRYMGVKTVSYQYSNLSYPTAGMMTTSDKMLTFSPASEQIWGGDAFHPQELVPNGYIFDSSIKYVRKRSAQHRKTLKKAGASFVICYLDENFGEDRYGIVTRDEYRAEWARILRWLAQDSTLGLVAKTQFLQNTPSVLWKGDSIIESACATGRFLELFNGAHRNTVFPAEGALVADITIGYMIGATASLEAALAGCRSIMINPSEWRGAHNELYSNANLVFETLDEAISAIKEFRSGSLHQANLGDWTPIIHHFDPYRDGQAGWRTRDLLDELLACTPSEGDPLPTDRRDRNEG